MREITNRSWKTLLLTGKDANKLAHQIFIQASALGKKVHIVDSAGRFQAYQVAEATKWADFPILHHIFVQRAFTPYQLLDFTNSLLGEAIQNPNSGWYDSTLFFLAPSKQFFDGDVKQEERIYLLQILIQKFLKIQDLGIPFLISESIPKKGPVYAGYLKDLAEILRSKPFEYNIPETQYGKNSQTLFASDPAVSK
jgi:hypothetical protein